MELLLALFSVLSPIDPVFPGDRVGQILIVGNKITDQRVILSQLGLCPGQVLSGPALKQAEDRLLRLGIFDLDFPPRVQAYGWGTRYKTILVTVRETRTGIISVGAYLNNDPKK